MHRQERIFSQQRGKCWNYAWNDLYPLLDWRWIWWLCLLHLTRYCGLKYWLGLSLPQLKCGCSSWCRGGREQPWAAQKELHCRWAVLGTKRTVPGHLLLSWKINLECSYAPQHLAGNKADSSFKWPWDITRLSEFLVICPGPANRTGQKIIGWNEETANADASKVLLIGKSHYCVPSTFLPPSFSFPLSLPLFLSFSTPSSPVITVSSPLFFSSFLLFLLSPYPPVFSLPLLLFRSPFPLLSRSLILRAVCPHTP